MADTSETFSNWLADKLKQLNTDEVVYGNYIRAILDSNETEDEKAEALESVIAGITEENISEHVASILVSYEKLYPNEEEAEILEPVEDVEVRLAKMMESQSLPTTTQKSYTAEELKIRQAILSQYSQMSDGEEDEADGDEEAVVKSDCGIEKNTNAATILQKQREMREKAKLDSQKKKEKDKEDREKQKQIKEEKKEKRKTTKGERRR